MSVLPEGRTVCCDGFGCQATAPLPVSLRRTLGTPAANTEAARICGWLFAGPRENRQHFCPQCTSDYLLQALEREIGPASPACFSRQAERRKAR